MITPKRRILSFVSRCCMAKNGTTHPEMVMPLNRFDPLRNNYGHERSSCLYFACTIQANFACMINELNLWFHNSISVKYRDGSSLSQTNGIQ